MDLNILKEHKQLKALHIGDAIEKPTDVWEKLKPVKLVYGKWRNFTANTTIGQNFFKNLLKQFDQWDKQNVQIFQRFVSIQFIIIKYNN